MTAGGIAMRAGAATAWMLGALTLAGPALAQQRPAAPAQPAPAQQPAAQPPPAAQTERNWRVACDEMPAAPPRNCRLSTAVILRPQNQRLAQVVLMRQPETRSLGLVFQLPHGALLPAGMTWQVDEGEAQRLAFQTSDAEGLYAGIPVADDLLAALRRATTLRLTFVLAARREGLAVPIPLAQFSDAVAELFAAERAPAPAAAPAAPPQPRR